METLPKLARNKEERLFVARCLDHLRTADQKRRPVRTDFLDPGQAALLKQVGDGFSGVRIQTWGGYPEAERRRACVLPADSWDDRPDFGIAILRITPLDPDGGNPSHRDYLGSMLGLGLKREKLGDCLVRFGEALF
ncbi:MAG: hypothetical protein IBX71_10145 [Candidatus Desulforudis sp.]|nr:hypothetical protein [Desulforudis sp.]